MLIVLAGLPGCGKTTLARYLAKPLAATHLQVDAIEQALLASGMAAGDLGATGYAVMLALAEEPLTQGRTVIADAVHPVRASRQAWRQLASRFGAPLLQLELTCSDPDEHRCRVETRTADIPEHRLPSWEDVQRRHYESWDELPWVLDTAGLAPAQLGALVLARVRKLQQA